MSLSSIIRSARWLCVCLGLACLLLVLQAQSAHAQPPPTCNGLTGQLDNALTPAICKVLNLGSACLATRSVSATARTGTISFTRPGDKAQLARIRQMVTVPQRGSAILLGGSNANPVKILVFGDTTSSTGAVQAGQVFTLRARNGEPSCERTRSGMFLQTPNGTNGTIVVNGVTIQLGSTAYVVPGADLLFDQDPRIQRREGSRNRNAPLCSGFDSDCDFGDDRCSEDDRLVWGPFCRQDNYSYIEDGLYRVTLYGEGEVQAGATDYGIEREYDRFGSQRLTLPGSYTFCWNGLESGGTGFETIVQPRSRNAYVEHITLEYLGRDCGLPSADDRRGGMNAGEMGVMTVYNIEGNVGMELPNGQGNSADSGQRMRIYYDGGEPVDMDNVATDAPYVTNSDLARWVEGSTESEGLQAVEIINRPLPDTPGERPTATPTPTPAPSDPVVSVEAEVLTDDGYPIGMRVEAQAYDPSVGYDNSDGIDYVYFTIYDPYGNAIFENDEQERAYCAFGGDSPCEAYFESEGDEEWRVSGEFQVVATAYAESGREATATTSFSLDWGSPSDASSGTSDAPSPTVEPTPVTDAPPYLGSVNHNVADSYCEGDTITASVEVYDDSGTADVTFYWRVYYDDLEFPTYPGYPYDSTYLGSGTGTFSAQFTAGSNHADFYFSARDAAGNETSSGEVYLQGRSCEPVIN